MNRTIKLQPSGVWLHPFVLFTPRLGRTSAVSCSRWTSTATVKLMFCWWLHPCSTARAGRKGKSTPTPSDRRYVHTGRLIGLMLCSEPPELNQTASRQKPIVLHGALEVSDRPQNSRLGSSLAQIPDMNGDGFRELVVGAPLEDDHKGAVYVFYGQGKTIQHQYRQVPGEVQFFKQQKHQTKT